MTASQKRSIAQELNTWVQTIGILIAALWGAYTFIYKEITVPKTAPVEVTVELQLKKIVRPDSQRQQGKNKALIAVEMEVSAKNPTSRKIYLLPSAWVAYGIKVEALSKNLEYSKQVTATVNAKRGGQIEKYARQSSDIVPVASGSLFQDDFLTPNGKVTRTIVFHVPPGGYDLIEVDAYVPTTAKDKEVAWEWKYDEKNGTLHRIVYSIAKNGERKEIERDKSGNVDSELQLQTTVSI